MKICNSPIPSLLTSAFVALILVQPCRAQDTPPPVPKAVQSVVDNISDLALLHALLPLKLTTDQVAKLLVPLKEIAADNLKRIKTDQDALRELAPDVEKAKTTALAGETIPTDLEARLKQTSRAIDARLIAIRKSALDKMLAVVKDTLTPTQKDEVEAESVKTYGGRRIPAAYKSNPAKAPKEAVQDLALLGLVDDVLLSERAVSLLSQMKPAPTPSAAP